MRKAQCRCFHLPAHLAANPARGPNRGLSQISGVDGSPGIRPTLPRHCQGWSVILSAIAERLKRRSKNDFKGRHFEPSLILKAVSRYLRYPLSYGLLAIFDFDDWGRVPTVP